MSKRRIGILTAGGDCPGLNAVIRAVTKPAIGAYGMEVIGFLDGYRGVVESLYRKLSLEDVSGILNLGGTILGTSNRSDPFRYPSHGKGKTRYRNVSPVVLKNVNKLKLDGLIAIGGDGTLHIAHRLFKMGLNVVGVPKTIDNDLSETELTFGFDSAVSVATEAIDRLHTTAQSHHRVMVLEVMGRYSGWIALYAGVAGGGDVILIPEIPYDLPVVCQSIKDRNRRGKRFSIVVVAEGAAPRGGKPTVARLVEASTDPVRLGGIAEHLAEQIETRGGTEARYTVLGHLQRGGSPTAFDRLLATRFGEEALRLFQARDFGKMPALQEGRIKAVSIERAVGTLKKVPLDHPLIRAARSVGTSFGDE